jgi:hypothetical protein
MLYCTDNVTPIKMYYRTINASTDGTPSAGPMTTAWIDANTTSLPNAGPLSAYQYTSSGAAPIVNGIVDTGGNGTITVTGNPVTSARVPVYIPSIVFTTPTNNLYIIFRIGLPMNKGVTIQSVQATIS